MHLGSALVSTSGPPHGGNLMQGEWGCWAGAVEQNRGPQLPSLRLIQRSERCICTDSHPAPTAERRRIFRCTVYRDSHLRRTLERQRSSLRLLLPSPSAPACGPRFEKFRHTAAPDAPRLCSGLHRWATPRGKSDGGGVGVLGGGGRTKLWAPVASASAHPAERALYMYRFPPCADRRTPPHFPLYGVPIPPRRPRERQRSSLRLLLPSPSAPACGPRFIYPPAD
jgi:hypothetical protein